MNEQLQNIQKYRLAFLIVFIGMFFTNISAQTNSLTLHDLIQGNNKIFVYDPQLIISPFLDPIPTIHQMEEMGRLIDTDGPYNNIGSTHSALWLQLFTNEDTIQPDPVKQIENLSIRVRFLKTNGRLDSTETIQLQTGYNNVSLTPYVYYNSIKIDSVVFAYIEVTGIEYEESSISPVPFNHVITGRDTIDEINSLTQIRFVAKLDPIHVYNLSTIPPINGNSFACNVSATYIDLTGDIRVDWRAAGRPGEVSYTELEWTFVSTYPDRISNPSTIYDFRMNNTAVQISSPEVHYSLPMIFEKGVLIFRYRWVSLRGDDKKPVYSAWSLPESGTIGSVRCGKFEITNERIHESDQKNWQCIMSYAEEGKHKTVVTYYDGTMRSRQAVTRLSESNTVIVGETIYDFQGRPAIHVLPVPVGLSDSPVAYSTPGTGIDFAPDPSTYEAWQTAQETIIMENLGLYGSGGGSSSSIAGTEVVPDVPGQYLSQKIRYYPDFNLNNSDQPFSW